jgi:hypothetical protein
MAGGVSSLPAYWHFHGPRLVILHKHDCSQVVRCLPYERVSIHVAHGGRSCPSVNLVIFGAKFDLSQLVLAAGTRPTLRTLGIGQVGAAAPGHSIAPAS